MKTVGELDARCDMAAHGAHGVDAQNVVVLIRTAPLLLGGAGCDARIRRDGQALTSIRSGPVFGGHGKRGALGWRTHRDICLPGSCLVTAHGRPQKYKRQAEHGMTTGREKRSRSDALVRNVGSFELRGAPLSRTPAG